MWIRTSQDSLRALDDARLGGWKLPGNSPAADASARARQALYLSPSRAQLDAAPPRSPASCLNCRWAADEAEALRSALAEAESQLRTSRAAGADAMESLVQRAAVAEAEVARLARGEKVPPAGEVPFSLPGAAAAGVAIALAAVSGVLAMSTGSRKRQDAGKK
jgi:hypothetical protein